MANEYVRMPQALSILKCSKSTLYAEIAKGHIKKYVIEGRRIVRFKEHELYEYLATAKANEINQPPKTEAGS